MQQMGRLSHDGFGVRIEACGGGAGSENVAFGYVSGDGVVSGWMASPGHRRNILGNYTHCGIGKAGTYWCQLFKREL
jgi:uncharacterized protein YkwD